MPGKGFSYSNVGYNLLELIIEEVTERDFAEYMKNEILYPLGMYHSDFEWSEEALASAPLGYTLEGKPISPYRYPERSSGGLIASAEDIARFCIAEMSDFLNTQTGDITEFDDKLVRKLIEKVIVYDDRLLVEFKSGLEIEVKL